jgi:type II secretory pathway component PulL
VSDATQALKKTCEERADDCAYTSTTFLIWLRWLRIIQGVLLVAPVVSGAFATWKILAQTSLIWAAIAALITTIIPPAYKALRIEDKIKDYNTRSGEFTNLRDRFRYLARVTSHQSFEMFDADTKQIMKRLEAARSNPLTPPEWCFRAAQRKHKAGHYTYDTTR